MRKAFTLIELLAVIVILAIITVIAVPQILGVIEKTKENAYKLNLDLMKSVTETYIGSGQVEITGTSAVVKLDDLVDKHYISSVKDPVDKSKDCLGYIQVEVNGKDYTYTPFLKCGTNYVSDGYDPILAGEPVNTNAGIHQTTIPDGYTAIYKIEDLNNMRNNLSGNYILMNDLDFNSDSSYTNPTNKTMYTTGNGWLPVGDSISTSFGGQFNGNNHVIKNLYINRPTTDYIGLFGFASIYGIVEKLGLENMNIIGKTNVGGISGLTDSGISQGTVRNCYTTGTVVGTSNYVGGIVGRSYGKVMNSYSIANVTGNSFVGGLVGSSGTINNSFSVGNVTATVASGGYFGKLSGSSGGTVTNSYYSADSTLTGTGTIYASGESTPLEILKTQLYIKYKLGWDVDNIWFNLENELPTLGGTTGEKITIQTDISKIEDLYLIRYNLNANYNLLNNLDFNNVNDYRNPVFKELFTTNLGWLPVGDSISTSFGGQFNGNNHVIKNLYINRPTTDYVGLFGFASIYGIVEKLGLENMNIIGKTNVGGISGLTDSGISQGTVRNCYTTGTVVGTSNYVGGIVGRSYGKVMNSYSIANVTGNSFVGGLVGSSGTINNSFSVGNVTATVASGGYFGRLSGSSGGTVTNSYYSTDSTLTGTGTTCASGTSSMVATIQPLTLTGLDTWDTSTIWRVNSGAYPTFR